MDIWTGWRTASEQALYGDSGFFLRPEGPSGHFRTSVHASPLFADAVARLAGLVDSALGHPARIDVVDVGAGRGELAEGLLRTAGPGLAERLLVHAVERAPRPRGLDPRIRWGDRLPEGVTGLVLANEWLDNIPVDAAGTGPDGTVRLVLVGPDGEERPGGPVEGEDAAWLDRWWPLGPGPARARGQTPGPAQRASRGQVQQAERVQEPPRGLPPGQTPGRAREPVETPGPREGPVETRTGGRAAGRADGIGGEGRRAEIGLPRDRAWAGAVASLRRGLAVAVDYAHERDARPPFGTLTGFRDGREVRPVPDGSCDITAHVALDACAAAAEDAAQVTGTVLTTQRAALRALGVCGGRPPLDMASTDPAGYVRALAAAGEAAELTDPGGLGSFTWLLQGVGMDVPAPLGPGGPSAPGTGTATSTGGGTTATSTGTGTGTTDGTTGTGTTGPGALA